MENLKPIPSVLNKTFIGLSINLNCHIQETDSKDLLLKILTNGSLSILHQVWAFVQVLSSYFKPFLKPGLLQTFILNLNTYVLLNPQQELQKKLQFIFSRTRSTSLCPFQKVSQFNDVQKKYKRIFCLTWKSLLCLMSSLSI